MSFVEFLLFTKVLLLRHNIVSYYPSGYPLELCLINPEKGILKKERSIGKGNHKVGDNKPLEPKFRYKFTFYSKDSYRYVESYAHTCKNNKELSVTIKVVWDLIDKNDLVSIKSLAHSGKIR